MIIANSSSVLRSQIARLQELGKHEEAMTVLQRFLELEREAHATNIAENDAEPKSTIIAFPRLRPVS
ncbi:MAG: hypothetical protein DKT66_01870 [Candidatus Melainabacteria bacterium]|nr:MAG: hypothetical protein DKT66_01870 [Candidatus Melainabacteria bacterium]